MLVARNGHSNSLTLEGRVLAPVQGIDESLRITVADGVISAIEPGQAGPLVVAPAFVDPHVHLRTPGREDEETILSGTEAAAAGGYCAILAMPNTEPVVDSAAVLGALVARARESALIPVGFMAAISKGQSGEELTEMAELAANGAAAFTDDGKPVASASLMRRALQYSALTDLRVALHCEEPSLSHGGHMHEGTVSAELGIGPYPSTAESVMVERDLSLASTESRPVHLMHLSARESVEALERALATGVEATAEVTPHHLVLTDEAVRSLDPNVKMNPPLRASTDRAVLRDALRRGSISCIGTDHAPHARQEKDVPFEEAPFGVIGLETAFASLYTHLVVPGELSLETLLERISTGPARAFGLDEPRIEVGVRANLVALDLDAEWTVTEDGFRSLSANSWLLRERLRGRVVATVADGRLVFDVGTREQWGEAHRDNPK
jgi:dihydroorotase